MRRRLTWIIVAVSVAVLLSGVIVATRVIPRFSQLELSVSVDGPLVTGTTRVAGLRSKVVQEYGVCTRSTAGERLDLGPMLSDVRISRSGTSYTSEPRAFAPGTYTYFACVLDDDHWITVGATKSFTIPASQVLFEDDFDGPAGALPDPARWGDYSGCKNAKQAFGSIRCGADETLTGTGQLSVPAAPTWGSGLTTAGKFDFEYGTYSAWIKIPATVGYWPAFWTENRPSDFHDVPLYGETDALEAYTFEPRFAHSSGVLAWGLDGLEWAGHDNYCSIPGVDSLADGFHKYSMRIEPSSISGFVDDKQCGKTVYRANDRPWPFRPDTDLRNYLILNLAVGGADGRQPKPKGPDVMLVDRVEVRGL